MEGKDSSAIACKITVYFIFFKNSSDKCPLPMVSIKCQSQYNALILAGGWLPGDGRPSGGSLRPGPSSAGGPCPSAAGGPGARGPQRCRAGRGGERALRAPAAGRLKQIHGLHFRRLPGGDEAGGGSGSYERADLLFLSPLPPQSELQAYMVKEKKNNKENV